MTPTRHPFELDLEGAIYRPSRSFFSFAAAETHFPQKPLCINTLRAATAPSQPRDNPATPRDKFYILPHQARQRRGDVAA